MAQWGAEPEEGAGQPALPQPMLRGQAGAPGGRRPSVRGNHERTLCLLVVQAAQPRERLPGVTGGQS